MDEPGIVRNAELYSGSAEVWLDGDPNWWKARGRRPEEWIGVWVDDVDRVFARVSAAGIEAQAPAHRFCGVRVFQVSDPEGYTWGFMQRAPCVARTPP